MNSTLRRVLITQRIYGRHYSLGGGSYSYTIYGLYMANAVQRRAGK